MCSAISVSATTTIPFLSGNQHRGHLSGKSTRDFHCAPQCPHDTVSPFIYISKPSSSSCVKGVISTGVAEAPWRSKPSQAPAEDNVDNIGADGSRPTKQTTSPVSREWRTGAARITCGFSADSKQLASIRAFAGITATTWRAAAAIMRTVRATLHNLYCQEAESNPPQVTKEG